MRLAILTVKLRGWAASHCVCVGHADGRGSRMRLVQALHWLKDTLPSDSDHIRQKIGRLLTDKKQGDAIRDDLTQGFGALPIWMQDYLRPVLDLMPDAASVSQPTPAQKKSHSDIPAGVK